MQYRRAILVAVSLLAIAKGQTLVDLRTQSKSVDFSAANTTKPFKAGTVLPATCGVGEAFFQTNAPAGLNLYGCTAVNSWTLLSAGVLAGDVTGARTRPSWSSCKAGRSRRLRQPADNPWRGAAQRAGLRKLSWERRVRRVKVAGSTGPQGPAGANGAIAHIQNSGTAFPLKRRSTSRAEAASTIQLIAAPIAPASV